MLKTRQYFSPKLLAFYSSMTIAIVFILFSPPSSVAQTPGPADLLNYVNPTYGIKIQYPKDWTASTSGIPTYNGVVGFYSPLKNITDVHPAEVTLSITTYAPTISLADYTKTTLAILEKQGIKIDESKSNTLSGQPAYRVTFSPTNPAIQNIPINLKVMQTWTVIDNKVYLLSFSADTQKFSLYLPVVQKILDSLQIQPPAV
jgi:serine/threonine-protein kinase